MFKRIRHAIFGHAFEQRSASFCAGTNRSPVCHTESAFQEAWGFTQFVYVCSCGKVMQVRAVGKHGGCGQKDSELESLRKLAGL